MSRSSIHRPLILLLSLLLCLPVARVYAAPAGNSAGQKAAAQSLIEAGDAEAALQILNKLIKKGSRDGEALLLRSTAHFMNGDISSGRADLDRAIEVDPTLRQAWLNRAALDISELRLEPALAALLRARDLDPSATDNEVNIGAVLLLMGRVEEADRSFELYLAESPGSAEAHYLVATNYAMVERNDRAVRELARATALDELSRLRARTDPNFAGLVSNPGFQKLLTTDSFRPAPGSLRAAKIYDLPYEGPQSLLLATVLEVIQLSNRPMAPRVEVTDRWALVWTDVRIKIDNVADGRGQVSLTAPPRSFSAEGWRALTESLLSSVAARLHAKRLKSD